MAKIKLLASRATQLGTQPKGRIIDVAPKEAKRMIAAGHAVAVKDDKKP